MQRREGMEWLHMQFVKPPDIGHSSVWAVLASSHIASVRMYVYCREQYRDNLTMGERCGKDC